MSEKGNLQRSNQGFSDDDSTAASRFSPLSSTSQTSSKWCRFLPEIILLNVRWYCRYLLSYRNLEEMMAERGVEVDHSTINRWVLKFALELDKRLRPHLSLTNDLWRVNETDIEVKGEWKYLYRAVDLISNTLDFMLSAKRDGKAAARFFRKVLKAGHTQTPRVIMVDQNAAYPVAMDKLKAEVESSRLEMKGRVTLLGIYSPPYLSRLSLKTGGLLCVSQKQHGVSRMVMVICPFSNLIVQMGTR